MHEPLGRLEERLVANEFVGQRLWRAGGLEGADHKFVGPSEVTAGELGVVVLEGDQAELDVGLEKVGALGEQPDEFVVGDLGLARFHHRLDLLDVLLPLAAAAGMDEFPGGAAGEVAAGDREFFHAAALARSAACSVVVSIVAHRQHPRPRNVHYTADGLTARDRRVQVSRVRKAAGKRSNARAADAVGIADPAGLRRRLTRWYARAKRDLPWRRTRDPYAVWVSEVMLQQTQVDRVKEFFARFMRRFPAVGDLAAAREAEVLKHWEGLGYYRRARQLHAAAKAVIADHGGEFPRSVDGLRSLPGIGRYTAGAIASIAFDHPAPIVEANSRRVLARVAGHEQPVGGAGDEPIWEIASAVVPKRGAGVFNQALMDLGAMVCTPTRPLCERCPLKGDCAAVEQGRVAEIPVMAAPRATKEIRETAVVTRCGDRVLVIRRGPGEWWEGLWDFPREPRGATGRRIGRVAYGVTHHRIDCTVVERRAPSAGAPPAGGRWVRVSALAGLAMTSPGRRIAAIVADHGAAASRSGSLRGGRRLIRGGRSANLVKPSSVE